METPSPAVEVPQKPEERILEIQREYNDLCARLGEMTFHYKHQSTQLANRILELQIEAGKIEAEATASNEGAV